MGSKLKKIRQSNELIESPYSQEFSPHEIKIFEIAIASCTEMDNKYIKNKSDKEFMYSNNELAKLLNTNPSVISQVIEKTAKRIMKKTLHLRKIIEDGSIEFEMINIIPYANYKNGIFRYRLNYSIIPYILEVNKNFTEYQLHYILTMRSAYAIKLYKLLYQYKNIKSRKFTIVELKEQFGIANKYDKYTDFKTKIINPSTSQINELTDIEVSYEEIKFSRRIEEINFKFTTKKKLLNKNIDTLNNYVIEDKKDEEFENIIEKIKDKISDVTKHCLDKYYKEKGTNYVAASVEYAVLNSKTNFDKYLQDTLNKNWGLSVLNQIENKQLQKQKKQDEVVQEKEQQMKQKENRNRDHVNRNNIEHEFYKLPDISKEPYEKYTSNILKKHQEKLSELMGDNLEKLIFSVYAVSNNKCYNRVVETYCTNMLHTNLSVYK